MDNVFYKKVENDTVLELKRLKRSKAIESKSHGKNVYRLSLIKVLRGYDKEGRIILSGKFKSLIDDQFIYEIGKVVGINHIELEERSGIYVFDDRSLARDYHIEGLSNV